MATLEREIEFLLAATRLLDREESGEEETSQASTGDAALQLTPSEREVLAELLLSEKHADEHADSAIADGLLATVEELSALLVESPLSAMYTGDTTSPYTRFILSFYSSALYAQLPTKVNTSAVRLFQRFLCACRGDALRQLHTCCGANMMDVVLRECLSLSGNLSSTVQIASPTNATGLVLGELNYDAHEVSPLDYLDVFLPHIPYLSQMCQQAALLLLAHEEMVRVPSSFVVLLTILFTIRNMGNGQDAVEQLMRTWPSDREALFYRMDAFLNRFT